MNKTFGNSCYRLGTDRMWLHKMFEIDEPLMAKVGGKIVSKEYSLGTEPDFTSLIERIAASKADVRLFTLKEDGLTIEASTGSVTVGKAHHSTLKLPLAKSVGLQLATVSPLGQVAPQPGCTST